MTAAAPLEQASTTPYHKACRVLVAEDSAITHDLLRLLLNQRGHHVDIATDGLQALEALRNNTYEVALLDYHLPELDGLEVAAAIKSNPNASWTPRLIAITADPEGLLSAQAGCENFDYILPKPLDINEVCKVVEAQAALAGQEQRTPEPQLAATTAAPGASAPLPPALVALRLNLLAMPDDINAEHLSRAAQQAALGDGRFDAIVVKAPITADDLLSIWRHKALFALPVIDLTGTLGKMADLDASKLEARETDQIERLVHSFEERRSQLHRDLLQSEEIDDRLLGRVYVSGQPLTALIDGGSTSCVTYDVSLEALIVRSEAAKLKERGLFTETFVERFHVCPRCSSSRIHVRNVCVKCHSSNLAEEQFLHHFRCGFKGPKSEFRDGLKLVCPKCHHELGDYDVDYERADTLVICRTCGHTGASPSVGMLCLDCDAEYDWNGCRTRDAYTYELTDQGRGYAEYGRSFLGLFQKPLRFEELPNDLILALNEAAKHYTEAKTPFTLLNIFYKNERRIVEEQGRRRFAEARERFLSGLRSALGSGSMVVKGPSSYDFALLPGKNAHQAERDFPGVKQRATNALDFDLGATAKAFGPQDF